MYLMIQRFNLIGTLQFLSLTGVLASMFSLIGAVLIYWFAPSSAFPKYLDIETDPLIDEILNFVNYLISRNMAEAIKINLIFLIGFVVILIIAEVIKKLYPPKDTIESHTAISIQISMTLIIGIVVFYVCSLSSWNDWRRPK